MSEDREPLWDCVNAGMSNTQATWRLKVPGGWIVKEEYYSAKNLETPINGALCFYPDPGHEWMIEE